jgi:hypothetical protein
VRIDVLIQQVKRHPLDAFGCTRDFYLFASIGAAIQLKDECTSTDNRVRGAYRLESDTLAFVKSAVACEMNS